MSRELLQIIDGLIRRHAHRHGDHQRPFPKLVRLETAAPLDVGDDHPEFRGIGGIQEIDARSSTQQTKRLIHRLIFDGSPHAGPDQILHRHAVRFANSRANFGDLLGDSSRPFGMILGLPGEIEYAIAVGSDASVFHFHADGDQRAARRVEARKSFTAHPRIQRL